MNKYKVTLKGDEKLLVPSQINVIKADSYQINTTVFEFLITTKNPNTRYSGFPVPEIIASFPIHAVISIIKESNGENQDSNRASSTSTTANPSSPSAIAGGGGARA